MSTQIVTITYGSEVDTIADAAQVQVVTSGTLGPQGPPVAIVPLTQAAYDALDPPDPTTFYVIVP